MIKLQLKYFRASHLMQLKNREFGSSFDRILKIFEEEEFSEEFVATNYEDAKAESEKLASLRNMSKEHHLTEEIHQLKKIRFDSLMIFTSTAKNGLRSPFANTRAAARVLDKWLKAYDKSLKHALIDAQSSLVKEMLGEIDSQSRISGAIETLDLKELFTSITETTKTMHNLIDKRGKEMADDRRKATLLKRGAYAKLIIFLNSIEMVLNMHGGDNEVYMRYVKIVNEQLDYYKAIVLGRSTRHKNSAENEASSNDNDVNGENGESAEGNNNNTTTTTTKSQPKMMKMYNDPYSVLTLNDSMDMDVQAMAMANDELVANGNALNEHELDNDEATTNGGAAYADNAEEASLVDDKLAEDDDASVNGSPNQDS